MSRIAIIAALEREIRPLVRTWQLNHRVYEERSFRIFERDDLVAIGGGIGPEAARRAAEALLALYDPQIIYSAGFAGALNSSLKIADVIRPARVVNAGDGSSIILENGSGVLVSFTSVASPAQKAKLRDSFGAIAVDMEAAAVARAAELRGVRFEAIKAISDTSDFELPPTEKFVAAGGSFSEFKFGLFAALRPWLWFRVLQLARNSSRASQALCLALAETLKQPTSEVHPSSNR